MLFRACPADGFAYGYLRGIIPVQVTKHLVPRRLFRVHAARVNLQ